MSVSEKRVGIYSWIALAICFLCVAFAGTTSMFTTVYFASIVKSLSASMVGMTANDINLYINIVYIFGWMLGILFSLSLRNNVGHKHLIVFSVFCYSFFTILTGLSMSWQWLVIWRGLSGFGVGSILVVSFDFMSETWDLKKQNIALGVLGFAFSAGVVVAGLIGLILSDWSEAFITGSIPLIISTIALWTLRKPEKEKTTKTRSSLKDLFAVEHRENFFCSAIIIASLCVGAGVILSWLPEWEENLRNGPYHHGMSVILLGTGILLGNFLSGKIRAMLSTKKTLVSCFVGCFLLSLLLFKINTTFSAGVNFEIMLLAFLFSVGQNTIQSCLPKLFPEEHRITFLHICLLVGLFLTILTLFFSRKSLVIFEAYGSMLFVFSFSFLFGAIAVLYTKIPD